MARIEARVLKGFRDYLPDVMIVRKHLIDSVSAVFERFGFSPLDTPALEYSEILLGKYGEDAEKLLYRFSDNGGRDVCMRYDLTVPLARMVAMNRNAPRPFKRYQVGTVWRAESPGRGRFREFAQCDVDIVGSKSLMADAECLAVDAAVMKALGVDATIRVNNRKVFRGLQEILGIEDSTVMNAVIRIVDKILKIGPEGVARELGRDLELSEAQVERTMNFCAIKGDATSVLEELSGLFQRSEIGMQGVEELREVLRYAAAMDVQPEIIVLDPSIARGTDYYTGTVFETFMNDLPEIGSVMSGGRYDDLIGVYAGEQIPAVGISVGLDRLLAGMLELGKLQTRNTVSSVLVTIFSPEVADYALSATNKLRAAGVDAEIYLDDGAKLKKQMKYAEKLGIPLVVIAGPDEAEAGQVSLRDMKSGEQLVIAIDDLSKEVVSRVGKHDDKRSDYRSWDWSWDRESIAAVPEVRGVYILRDGSKDAMKAGFIEEGGLRAGLEAIFESERDAGTNTFDWYEVGNVAFGKDLADFLQSRLVRSE